MADLASSVMTRLVCGGVMASGGGSSDGGPPLRPDLTPIKLQWLPKPQKPGGNNGEPDQTGRNQNPFLLTAHDLEVHVCLQRKRCIFSVPAVDLDQSSF